MGILTGLREAFSLTPALNAGLETVILPPVSGDVVQVSNLPANIAAAFGINLDSSSNSISRKQAMSIPAVAKGRSMIAGTLGTIPLISVRRINGQAPERLSRQLFTQPDPNVTRAYTLTWTIDDLIFYGISWWQVMETVNGFPTRARRVPAGGVSVDTTAGVIRIFGREVDPLKLIRFDGPDEGILYNGGRTLRTALLLEEAVRRYATMDIPLGFFEDLEGSLDGDQIQQVLDDWETARQSRSTGYIPAGLKYNTPGFNAEQVQLSEARSYMTAEIARLMNLPANAINAPTNDSLTYSTTQANRRELVDMTFSPYIAAIEGRLSMDDITPHGTTCVVDLAQFLRGDTQETLQAAALAISSGIMTRDEIRQEWFNLPPLGASEEANNNV